MRRRGPTNTTFAPQTFACRVMGCRFRFGAEGRTMRWWCQRGCPSGGEKTYASEDEARRMAAVLDREPRSPANLLAVLGGTVHREPRDGDRPGPPRR
ncbi:MAG TPA: hypothetical protein VE526_13015 [Solirubrobacteraceae bacterium]|nr:hypothetical protein [Solirubrobacteraceae bacterium]